jgi:hypothetical protein
VTLHAAPRPCTTCPYRRDTPAGIWHPDEYHKLVAYDDEPGPFETFHCHQENATGVPTVCRGWLSVHPDSVAVRLAIARGALTVEQRDAPPMVDLYISGTEARDAGLAGVENPSTAARVAIRRLTRKGAGR